MKAATKVNYGLSIAAQLGLMAGHLPVPSETTHVDVSGLAVLGVKPDVARLGGATPEAPRRL